MQAEIVDETDLFVDNERSITVNAAALAQALPDQLRLALQSPQHQAVVAGVAGALAGAAAAGAGRPGTAVNVRKLFRQRSSSTLAPPVSAPVGGISPGVGGSGSWAHPGDIVTVSSPVGGTTPAAGRGPTGPVSVLVSSSGGGSSGASSTGVVAAVSAGLAAAAAAVGGKGPSGDGKGAGGTERLPLLSSAEQQAAGHNK